MAAQRLQRLQPLSRSAARLEDRSSLDRAGRLADRTGGIEAPAGFDRDDELR
jgi:hypothetical protein